MADDLEEEGPAKDLDEVAARVLRRTVRASPALFASLLFHACVLAVLPLVMFAEKLHEPETIAVKIGVDAQRIDPERNYKPVSSAPPSADGEGVDEPPVFFPDAIFAERNESVARDDRSKLEGDEQAVLMHLTDDPFSKDRGRRNDLAAAGVHDSIGVGGGAGRGATRFGTEGGGRRDLVVRGGGSAATEQAVERGLAWLARHQLANGCIPAGKLRCDKCGQAATIPNCDTASTALAALAFLTAGYGPASSAAVKDEATGAIHRYGDTVRSALAFLVSQQQKDGLLVPPEWKKEGQWPVIVYSHAFATLALSDAYRLTGTAEYKKAAQAGVDWLEKSQNPGAGWQYVIHNGASDLSVTGACVQALRAAKSAGLAVSPDALHGIKRLVESLSEKDGTAGYMNRGDANDRPALTAIAFYTRRFLGEKLDDPALAPTLKRLAEGAAPKEGRTDFYQYYYSMLALFEIDGPHGASWKKLNETVTTTLVRAQHRPTDGCAGGSWEVSQDDYVKFAGRACATALNVLTLEVYYRYASENPSPR